MTCSVENCEKPVLARGMCNTHYHRMRTTGSVDLKPFVPKYSACTVEGCEAPHFERGFCRLHYSRWSKRGTTDAPQPKAPAFCSEEECETLVHSRGLCQAHYRRWMRSGSTARPERKNKPGPKPKERRFEPKPEAWVPKTHCPAGHPYDEENTYVDPKRGTKSCRACRRENMRQRRGEGPGRGAYNAKKTHCPHGHEYTEENTIRLPDGRRQCRTCAKKKSERHNVLRYGISLERYEELMAEQDGACAICRETFSRTPHVDHDHSCCPTGGSCGACVRGLLCGNCNNLLGHAKDNADIFRAAIEYIETGP